MAEILKGAPVAAAISERTRQDAELLRKHGVEPTLAIVRVGERPDDISYEKGAAKRCAAAGVTVRNVVLPADVGNTEFFEVLESLNQDERVHGILLFLPLPPHLDGEAARAHICPQKDVDGCTDSSLAGVFTNTETGFAPCTAQAAMEILHYYKVNCMGKRAAVIGRSLVIGRPVAMMLMHENATVTICHTKTPDIPSITRQADILIVCSGQMESIGAEYVHSGQTVIDVGIGWNEEKGKLCGDVRFDEVQQVARAITPVPGGVGAVTTSVLVSHVTEAAKRQSGIGRA